MKIKLLLSSIFFLVISNLFSQTNLNGYKYVIVPTKFDFLKQENQYQANALAKFLFEKNGFNAVMEGENYPDDLVKNRCLALRSDIIKEPGLFKTKLQIVLKDCFDKVVYTSKTGMSREKEYGKAYNEAIRNTFEFVKDLNYKYEPNENILAAETSNTQSVANNKTSKEIEELKAEIENLKKEKATQLNSVEKNSEPKVVTASPKTVPMAKIEPAKTVEKIEVSDVLYAQPNAIGFQLVDSSPKVVYKIQKTGLDNVFLVEGKSAIVFKKGSSWVVQFYSGNSLKTEVLNIKF